MTLVLKNLQNIVKLRMCQIEKDVALIRRLMEIERFDVSVLFVPDDYIQKLNHKYRNVDEVTDVLSFPTMNMIMKFAEPGILAQDSEEVKNCDDSSLLGDVFLAPLCIQQQCVYHGEDFNHTLMTVIAGSVSTIIADMFPKSVTDTRCISMIFRDRRSHDDVESYSEFKLHMGLKDTYITTITHGLCHLVGYDHETADQHDLMIKTESTILERFNKI